MYARIKPSIEAALLIQITTIDRPESMSRVNNYEHKKPGTGDQEARITLKVRGQDGIEVYFRIGRSTTLKKLMIVYCNRQSIVYNSTVFLFKRHRVRGEQTPDELQMEEGGCIHVISNLTEELRRYLDQLIARTLALEEEVIRLRNGEKDEEENSLLTKVRRVVSELIAENSALKEELTRLTRLKKDEEEDAVFIKVGRLLIQRIAESRSLKEKLIELWTDDEEDDEKDDDEDEHEEEGDDDDLFIELGRIVSELVDKSE